MCEKILPKYFIQIKIPQQTHFYHVSAEGITSSSLCLHPLLLHNRQLRRQPADWYSLIPRSNGFRLNFYIYSTIFLQKVNIDIKNALDIYPSDAVNQKAVLCWLSAGIPFQVSVSRRNVKSPTRTHRISLVWAQHPFGYFKVLVYYLPRRSTA